LQLAKLYLIHQEGATLQPSQLSTLFEVSSDASGTRMVACPHSVVSTCTVVFDTTGLLPGELVNAIVNHCSVQCVPAVGHRVLIAQSSRAQRRSRFQRAQLAPESLRPSARVGVYSIKRARCSIGYRVIIEGSAKGTEVRLVSRRSRALAAETAGELDVLGLDRDALG